MAVKEFSLRPNLTELWHFVDFKFSNCGTCSPKNIWPRVIRLTEQWRVVASVSYGHISSLHRMKTHSSMILDILFWNSRKTLIGEVKFIANWLEPTNGKQTSLHKVFHHWLHCLCRMVKVADFKSLAPYSCGFKSHQELWIHLCERNLSS
jgi:hypothetical protein